LERVQTKEDVDAVFNAKKEIERLQAIFFKGLRDRTPDALPASRAIKILRRETYEKYRVLI
jgi:hypothetical protein